MLPWLPGRNLGMGRPSGEDALEVCEDGGRWALDLLLAIGVTSVGCSVTPAAEQVTHCRVLQQTQGSTYTV